MKSLLLSRRALAINARQKGKRGEVELAGFLRALGWKAERAESTHHHRDLVTNIPRMMHPECKFQEGSGRIYEWLDQAIGDASEGEIPVVMHRRRNQSWVAILRLEDLLDLVVKPFNGRN
jgi:hypothetical protein